MKKFKHKKTGTVVQQFEVDGDYKCTSTTYDIPKWTVENSCDWVEIKDEYPKIISFRKTKGDNLGILSTLHPNGFYSVNDSTDECVTLNNMLKGEYSVEDEYFEIHQVAKSKDEIFTIGDRIQHSQTKNVGEIAKINLINGSIYFSTTYNESIMGTILENAVKLSTPLFVTEDGVEIYDLDHPIYVINVNDNYHLLSKPQTLRNTNSNWKHLKIFYVEEAAEKWIGENKPVFSKKQIRDALNDLDNSFLENRIKFFKEKLGI